MKGNKSVNQRSSLTNNLAANRIVLQNPLNPIGPNGEALVKASPVSRVIERNSTSRNARENKLGMNMTQQHLNLSSELASILDAATKMQSIGKIGTTTLA